MNALCAQHILMNKIDCRDRSSLRCGTTLNAVQPYVSGALPHSFLNFSVQTIQNLEQGLGPVPFHPPPNSGAVERFNQRQSR